MEYLFITLLLFSPLPSCFILYEFFKKQSAEVSGTFFQFFKLKISGIILIYVLILLINTLFFYPGILPVETDNVRSNWHYKIQIHTEHESEPIKLQGNLRLHQLRGHSIEVYDTSKHSIDRTPKLGMQNRDLIYFPLSENVDHFSKQNLPPIAAFGTFDQGNMELSIYAIATATLKNGWHGTIELQRSWPFGYLTLAIILPICIVWLLQKLGPSIAGLRLNTKLLPEKKYSIILHGSVISYLLVLFFLLVLANEGIPKLFCHASAEETSACQHLTGQYQLTVHANAGTKALASGYANISCSRYDKLNLSGHFDNNIDHTHYAWRSIISASTNNGITAIYHASVPHNHLGILQSIQHRHNDQHHFKFNDFTDHHTEDRSNRLSYGHITLEKIPKEPS